MMRPAFLMAALLLAACAHAQQSRPPAPSGKKPNILVIFGDDIGVANVSAYGHGVARRARRWVCRRRIQPSPSSSNR
jgi:hypothetical protein